MTDFPTFDSVDEFFRYLEQLVADIREGRVKDPPRSEERRVGKEC